MTIVTRDELEREGVQFVEATEEQMAHAFSMTDVSPFIRAAVLSDPEAADITIMGRVMSEFGGKANPTKVAEMIVSARQKGDGSIVAKAASPHSHDATPKYVHGFGVSWEPV